MYYRYGTELGITTGVQTTEHEYLYMAAAASTNRSLRVFTLISTGGTASSSLHAAFNKPPLTKTLKEGQRVRGRLPLAALRPPLRRSGQSIGSPSP